MDDYSHTQLTHASIDLDRVRSMRFPLVARGFEAEAVLDTIAALCDEVELLRAGGGVAHLSTLPPSSTHADTAAALQRMAEAIERLGARVQPHRNAA